MAKGIICAVKRYRDGLVNYYTPIVYLLPKSKGGWNWVTDEEGSWTYYPSLGSLEFDSVIRDNDLVYPTHLRNGSGVQITSYTYMQLDENVNGTTTTDYYYIKPTFTDSNSEHYIAKYCSESTLYKITTNNMSALDTWMLDITLTYSPSVGDFDTSTMDTYRTITTTADSIQCEALLDTLTLSATQFQQSASTLVVLSANSSYQPITYSNDGATYQASNTFTITTEGIYTFYAKDDAGFIKSVSVYVYISDYEPLYRLEIKDDLKGVSWRADIEEKGYAGAVTELTGTGSPMYINWQKKGDLPYFDMIKGSSARLGVFSPTNFAFLNLFQSEWDKYRLKIYRDAYIPTFDGSTVWYKKDYDNYRGSDNAGTILAWIVPNDTDSPNDHIFGVGSTSGTEQFVFQLNDGNRLQLVTTSGNTITSQTSAQSTMSEGTLYCVAVTCDGSTKAFYQDATELTTITFQSGLWVNDIGTTNTIDLGRKNNKGNQSSNANFDGKILEVAYCDRVLTSTEILEYYNGGEIANAKNLSFYDELNNVFVPDYANTRYTDLKNSHNLTEQSAAVWDNSGFINSQPYWYGFLNTEQHQESYAESTKYPVTFSFSDGIGKLKDEPYKDDKGEILTGRDSIINIIAFCLAKTGLSLYINVVCDVFEQNHKSDETKDEPLSQTYIDNIAFVGKNCYQVLTDILTVFGAFVYQYKGEWWVTRLHDIEGSHDVRKFKPTGEYISVTTSQTESLSITAAQTDPYFRFEGSNQTLSMEQALQKLKIERTTEGVSRTDIIENPNFKIEKDGGIYNWKIDKDVNVLKTTSTILSYIYNAEFTNSDIISGYNVLPSVGSGNSTLRLTYRFLLDWTVLDAFDSDSYVTQTIKLATGLAVLDIGLTYSEASGLEPSWSTDKNVVFKVTQAEKNQWIERSIEVSYPVFSNKVYLDISPVFAQVGTGTATLKKYSVEYCKVEYINSSNKDSEILEFNNDGRYKLEKSLPVYLNDQISNIQDAIGKKNILFLDATSFEPCQNWSEDKQNSVTSVLDTIDGTFESGIADITAGSQNTITWSTTKAYAGTYSCKIEDSGFGIIESRLLKFDNTQTHDEGYEWRIRCKVYITTANVVNNAVLVWKPISYNPNGINQVSKINLSSAKKNTWLTLESGFDRSPFGGTNIELYLIGEVTDLLIYIDNVEMFKIPKSSSLIGITGERILNAYSRPRQKISGNIAYKGYDMSLITNVSDSNNSGKVFLPTFIGQDIKQASYNVELLEIISKTNITSKILTEDGFPILNEDGSYLLIES